MLSSLSFRNRSTIFRSRSFLSAPKPFVFPKISKTSKFSLIQKLLQNISPALLISKQWKVNHMSKLSEYRSKSPKQLKGSSANEPNTGSIGSATIQYFSRAILAPESRIIPIPEIEWSFFAVSSILWKSTVGQLSASPRSVLKTECNDEAFYAWYYRRLFKTEQNTFFEQNHSENYPKPHLDRLAFLSYASVCIHHEKIHGLILSVTDFISGIFSSSNFRAWDCTCHLVNSLKRWRLLFPDDAFSSSRSFFTNFPQLQKYHLISKKLYHRNQRGRPCCQTLWLVVGSNQKVWTCGKFTVKGSPCEWFTKELSANKYFFLQFAKKCLGFIKYFILNNVLDQTLRVIATSWARTLPHQSPPCQNTSSITPEKVSFCTMSVHECRVKNHLTTVRIGRRNGSRVV